MGGRLQPAVLQSVLDHIAAHESNRVINRATGVTRKTIAKLRLSLEYWGVPYPPRCVRLGRPPTLRAFHRERLQAYLEGRPGASLEEMKDFLYYEFDIKTSVWTIYRELDRMGWPRKRSLRSARP
jgi:transposase